MNHSCQPNCAISYSDSHLATVTALRAIGADEELLISYVDETADAEQRRNQLVEYGFTCECERCVAGL